jgi:polysaccharide biosynthesis transport protein
MDARNHDFPPQLEHFSGGPALSSAGSAIGISDVLGTLRRGWRFPVFGCLIGVILAVCYIAFVPTLYKSSARILLDRSVTRYLQTNKIVDDPTFDDAEIASQVYILSSESIAVPVVRSMNLAHDGEFVGPSNVGGEHVNKVKNFLRQFIGWNDHADPIINPDADLEEAAVETYLKRLTVYREDFANVINVTFASEDPNKAASIANAIADTYIATTLEHKLKSTKIVSQWLQDRLMELKVQTMDADRALQDYKIANNLLNTGKGFLNSEQISNLNTQLTNSRVAVSEAKARLDGINQMPSEVIMGAASDVLTRFRSEYRDLAAKANELQASVGPGHFAVIKLRKKMDELRTSIRDEERRIADTYTNEYQNEYRIAKARESELAATAAQLVGEAGTSSQAQVKMRELESSADTLRSLYNTFLQKFKEINTLQTETIPIQNARILTRAAPLHKNSRKAAVVLAGSIVVGLFLGAGAALAREWAADVFRTPKAVEQLTGMHCVVLPTVNASPDRRALFRSGTNSTLMEEFVLDAPYSRFTEALRDIKTLINTAQLMNGGVKVIGVVSSVPKEGKTTIAANLAALFVASSGRRTLIIDSDVHLRPLTAKLAPDAREGLIEALIDPSRLPTLVCQMQRSGLDVLPCALSNRLPNAAELLGSPEMEQLLAFARKSYDFIVIDIAPIMSVVDLKMIERFIDRFVFVIEWGQTKRSLVLESLSEAQIIRERLIGVVLNKVDPFALKTVEAYKGNRFRDYYLEKSSI